MERSINKHQDSLFNINGGYERSQYYIPAKPRRLSDVQKARDWLKSWNSKWFTVEELKHQANLNIGVPALARKLRLARQRGEIESRVREGRTYMEYHQVRHDGRMEL